MPTIEDIRLGGLGQVADILASVPDRGVCVVNGAPYRDLEVLVAALFSAGRRGREFIARTAASFVYIGPAAPAKADLTTAEDLGGLFLIGPYVRKIQLEYLPESGCVAGLELRVENLLDPARRATEIEHITDLMNTAPAEKKDVAVIPAES